MKELTLQIYLEYLRSQVKLTPCIWPLHSPASHLDTWQLFSPHCCAHRAYKGLTFPLPPDTSTSAAGHVWECVTASPWLHVWDYLRGRTAYRRGHSMGSGEKMRGSHAVHATCQVCGGGKFPSASWFTYETGLSGYHPYRFVLTIKQGNTCKAVKVLSGKSQVLNQC